MDVSRKNWAGNVVFRASGFHCPSSVTELQAIVAKGSSVRALGSGHSFNRIADTVGELISVHVIPRPHAELGRNFAIRGE